MKNFFYRVIFKTLIKLFYFSFLLSFSFCVIADEYVLALKNPGEIWKVNKATNAGTKLASFSCPANSFVPSTSFVDGHKGEFHIHCNDNTYRVYNLKTGTVTTPGTDSTGYHRYYELPWGIGGDDNTTLIAFGNAANDNSSATVFGTSNLVGSDNKTIIKTTSDGATMFGNSNLVDSDNKTMIKTTSDGATHIGENSLVTIEENGRQSLYATNASGGKIDIDVNNGSDLLVKGVSVMGSIKGNAAIASAMSALPNTSDGNGYNCGVGTGFHGGASAFAIGCSSKFLPSRFNNAVFNIASSHVINSGYSNSSDDFSLRAGVSFKLGQSSIDTAYLSSDYEIEDELEKLKKENALILSQNKKLFNQINEINNKIELLNVIALK